MFSTFQLEYEQIGHLFIDDAAFVSRTTRAQMTNVNLKKTTTDDLEGREDADERHEGSVLLFSFGKLELQDAAQSNGRVLYTNK